MFPPTIASLGKNRLLSLIDFIYDQNTLQTPSPVTLQQKEIICPINETADTINSKVLEMVQDESTTYVSQDEATPVGNDGADTKCFTRRFMQWHKDDSQATHDETH
ncbi:DNA helicase [Tanacetum coccineum]